MTAPATVRPPETGRTGAPDQLRTLHAQGRIAAEYPSVPALLAELTAGTDPWAELSRAGRLLARTDAGEIAALHPGAVPLTTAITGHGTLDALVPRSPRSWPATASRCGR